MPPKPVQAPIVEISAPQPGSQMPPKPVQTRRVEIWAAHPGSPVPVPLDVETVRSDVLDFLNTRPDEWFMRLGKLKANLVQVIENEKTLEGMLILQGKTEEYELKYQELAAKDELRKQ
jgi:hypothetical protein